MTARRPRRLAVPQITAAFFSMTRKYSIDRSTENPQSPALSMAST
jgi:hypothetical protein